MGIFGLRFDMAFNGKKDGVWSPATAVYGKLNGAWHAAIGVWVKKDGSWTNVTIGSGGGTPPPSCTPEQYVIVNAYTNSGYYPADGIQMWIANIDTGEARLVETKMGGWRDVNVCAVCDCSIYNVADYDVRYCVVTGQYRWFSMSCIYEGY